MAWNMGKNTFSVAGCMMNLQMAHGALIAYSMEHDGKLPNANTWQTDVRPYYERLHNKSFKEIEESGMKGMFKVGPPQGDWSCEVGDGARSGLAFNSALSGKKVSDIKDPRSVILVFEVNRSGQNLNEPYVERPKESSPKLLGKPRGWLYLPVDKTGAKFDMESRSSSSNMTFDPKDALSGPQSGGPTKSTK